MPKFDPPLEITEEQRAAAMPWATLQLRLMAIGVASILLLPAYMIYAGLNSKVSLIVVAIWYIASEEFITTSCYFCSYQISRIMGDDGGLFQPRRWRWMFIRPIFVALMFYLIWTVPQGWIWWLR